MAGGCRTSAFTLAFANGLSPFGQDLGLMRELDPRIVRDVLTGLAPAGEGNPCPKCGRSTRALANGRGRLDICADCGTFELRSSEGVELLRLSARLPRDVRAGLTDLRLR